MMVTRPKRLLGKNLLAASGVAALQIPDGLEKERLGRHFYLRGFLAYRLGKPGEVRQYFTRSSATWPPPDNPSIRR